MCRHADWLESRAYCHSTFPCPLPRAGFFLHLKALLCGQQSERRAWCAQAITAAEAHYARSISAAAQVSLAGDCDGQTLRAALQGFSQLPRGVAHGREQVRAPDLDCRDYEQHPACMPLTQCASQMAISPSSSTLMLVQQVLHVASQ